MVALTTRTSALAFAAALVGGCGDSRALLETAAVTLTPSTTLHAEPPVEIYSRVARGALACWFGASGSLKRSHVFHADVAPEARGGGAEIVIFERDQAAPSPRALRAYRIAIARAPAGGSHLDAENLKLPEAVARDMLGDVRRWAHGGTGCSVVGVGGWAAGGPKSEAQPAPAEKPARKKVRRKASPASAAKSEKKE